MLELTLLLAFGLLGYYWSNQVSALDASRSAGKQLTQQKGWAFLDDSLMQKSIKLKTRMGKIALIRKFEFEFSDLDASRYTGIITHHGGTVTEIKFFHDNEIETIALTRY
ncbi:DUF3301 domain-containing protein [Marinicella litoralis]|uniref:Uncharacterized protein DUF3301 n=1 Tax=Marinicella litoralis TaxID=644220 RepID=A0A4R6Y0Y5_9GAMM|nr:DUF3301 domain-containing protein [Marinicella litoralis]TDR22598.1 uncharacterized protein DUF3301 [Marinicella litoralis]